MPARSHGAARDGALSVGDEHALAERMRKLVMQIRQRHAERGAGAMLQTRLYSSGKRKRVHDYSRLVVVYLLKTKAADGGRGR